VTYDILGEYKRAAVEYWTSELKPRTINSVKSIFRKVISTKQLRMEKAN